MCNILTTKHSYIFMLIARYISRIAIFNSKRTITIISTYWALTFILVKQFHYYIYFTIICMFKLLNQTLHKDFRLKMICQNCVFFLLFYQLSHHQPISFSLDGFQLHTYKLDLDLINSRLFKMFCVVYIWNTAYFGR